MNDLVKVDCAQCGFAIWMKQEVNNFLRSSGQGFTCLSGHSNVYAPGDSREDIIRRERDRLKQQMAQKDDEIRMWRATADNQRAQAERQRHRANGYKGHAARISKRAKAGTCPCCNRTFQQLARHMATQHPQFTPDVPELALKVVGGTAA